MKKKELWAPLISPTFLTAFRELGVAPDRFRVVSLLSGEKEEGKPLPARSARGISILLGRRRQSKCIIVCHRKYTAGLHYD